MIDEPSLARFLFRAATIAALGLAPVSLGAQAPPQGGFADAQRTDGAMPVILPLRERARVIDRWLERRMERVVPEIMRREGVDLWIVAAREYNEDPVIETMLPATWMAARRRTVLILHDRGPGQPIERLAAARYDIGRFPRAWDPETQPDQWARVAEIIAERDPARIAVNRSETFALADGLTGTEYDQLRAALPATYRDRVVATERLAIGWLETRTPDEIGRILRAKADWEYRDGKLVKRPRRPATPGAAYTSPSPSP